MVRGSHPGLSLRIERTVGEEFPAASLAVTHTTLPTSPFGPTVADQVVPWFVAT